MHYVFARALAMFKIGDICLILIYKAMFALLFGPMFLIVNIGIYIWTLAWAEQRKPIYIILNLSEVCKGWR